MRALPFVFAFAIAAVLAQPALRFLSDGGHTRRNYRARALPCPFGIVIVAAATLALGPVLLIERIGHTAILYPEVAVPVAVYVLGVACLGLIDDMFGDRPGVTVARGWRGHARVALGGEPSTGALKAGGSVGLALLAMASLGLAVGHWLLAVAVLVLATNALNLLDLRPGRAVKALVVLGAGLTIGTGDLRTLWTLGIFAGPALVVGWWDLRERALLGDTGSNLLGALAGLWLVLSLGQTGQLIALGVLVALNLCGELYSISGFVERVPLLQKLDSVGRR
jgi:UDP-GlcNAc:undecaprenyl-phosphate/decaprenyl-phosphate GlcNAc-1-phosphate transferase